METLPYSETMEMLTVYGGNENYLLFTDCWVGPTQDIKYSQIRINSAFGYKSIKAFVLSFRFYINMIQFSFPFVLLYSS